MSGMGQDLMEALQEALDHAEGKIYLKTSSLSISPVRENIGAEEIKETRQKMGMTQGVFAMVMGVSKKTVESWERGRYRPEGAARRLIALLQADPELPQKYGLFSQHHVTQTKR
jgi:putative transcriptional regulator